MLWNVCHAVMRNVGLVTINNGTKDGEPGPVVPSLLPFIRLIRKFISSIYTLQSMDFMYFIF